VKLNATEKALMNNPARAWVQGHYEVQDDGKEEPGKFGDLVMWNQLLDHAEQEGLPVILVTDENKEDWVRRIEGNTRGPRPGLIEELRERTHRQL
jgi:PIN like domain